MEEFRLKKKIQAKFKESLMISITHSFWNAYSIPTMYSSVYKVLNSPLSVWVSVRNNVQWSFEQK